MRGYAHKIEGTENWCNEPGDTKDPEKPELDKPAEPAVTAPETKSTPSRDPDSIKTTPQLQKALFEDCGLQPKDQLARLGIKTWADLAVLPSEAYKNVLATQPDK